MNKSEKLKNRFRALNVQKPSAYQPQAPQKEVPVKEHTRVESPRFEQPRVALTQNKDAHTEEAYFEATQKENAQNQSTQFEQTRNEIAQLKERAEPTEEKFFANIEQAQSKYAQKEYAQDVKFKNETAHLEDTKKQFAQSERAKLELTHREQTQVDQEVFSSPSEEELNGQPKGYFKLAHDVFWNPILRGLSGDSFRLFLWMSSRAWRYADSDGTVRASVRFIAENTGIARATVTRSLKSLRDENLIRANVDNHNGNLWHVASLAVGKYEKQSVQKEHTQKEHEAYSKRSRSMLKMSSQHAQNEANINYVLINKTNSTLSESDPENLHLYFQQVKPFRKREAEIKNFKSLLVDFSTKEIAECLEYLQKFGLPQNGEPCHSPFAFLAVSMSQVLEAISIRKEKQKNALSEREVAIRKQEVERREQEELERTLIEFESRFPTQEEQQEQIKQFKEKSGVATNFMPESVVRRLVAKWTLGQGKGLNPWEAL